MIIVQVGEIFVSLSKIRLNYFRQKFFLRQASQLFSYV